MSSLEKSPDAEILRNMGINIVVIFGVLTALIMISSYFSSVAS